MLAGEVYFYDKNEEVIGKMDLFDYEEMGEEKFVEFIKEIDCFKVTLNGYYNNHQKNPTIEIIYEKQKQ